jgi:RES domain-containing protein
MGSGEGLTPEDYSLDASIFVPSTTVTLFRLANPRFVQMDGLGAALNVGRWNRAGQAALYTSLAMETCVQEILAHVRMGNVPTKYMLMKMELRIPASVRNLSKKPAHSQSVFGFSHASERVPTLRVYETLGMARSAFEHPSFETPLAIALPSIRVPAWNVVLYPEGTDFWRHISLVSVEPFDRSLLVENT